MNSKLQPISRSGSTGRFCYFETHSRGSAKETELTYICQAEKDFIQGIGLQLIKGLEEQIQVRDYRKYNYRKYDGQSRSMCSLSQCCPFSHCRAAGSLLLSLQGPCPSTLQESAAGIVAKGKWILPSYYS